ncbi:hypothetical protein CCAX7_62370 [Capsulimonas corticalis]|uniref:Uncharacterized protein n=1 Tax=Capsulimonas corticalis TaxID=2219043 RepID=A0A402CWL7_9BACT|nr:hypothetical protein CCAX7_62370 [Capsulimonas corticalis]
MADSQGVAITISFPTTHGSGGRADQWTIFGQPFSVAACNDCVPDFGTNGWNVTNQSPVDPVGPNYGPGTARVWVPCDAIPGVYSVVCMFPVNSMDGTTASKSADFTVIANPDPTKTTIDGIDPCP